MRLAIVTDAICPDVTEAVRLGMEWGIRELELRQVSGRRVPDLSLDQVELLLRLQREHGIRYTALSPGTFKCQVTSPQAEADLEERLPRTLNLARRLGVTKVITFGFARGPEDPAEGRERVIRYLTRASRHAEAAGILLCLEPEAGFWCDTGLRTAEVVRAVGSKALRVNWDPGNCAKAGERPFPDGYGAVQGLVAHVHIKDYLPGSDGQPGRWVAPGDGVIDWPGQLAALLADSPVDYLTIETHFQPGVEGSRLSVDRIRGYLARLA
ncbi:MAG: sugar phosphate isomerase/epimerase family protein [Bacillota bacterium]